MLNKIEEVIKKEIRPYLLSHYGDMEVVSYHNGTLYVRLLGHCQNCPSAELTAQDIIESKLKEYIPEIKEVILNKDISEDLYTLAKEILNKKSRSKDEYMS
ncbi:NifU family protein [Irregularibacter muris]|uniref:NifU family protein n=1 Tax=Irregularibacter muris TaxID=1796619 RepID=A0AAE3HI93_9FIRM|nr:NifU family protein [Irregularibacter muris]MCR1899623.1 NifU family protein [Irregularibacter muris]